MKQAAKKSTVTMNTYYTIVSKQSGKALEIEGESKKEGALIQLSQPNGSMVQQWKAVKGSETGYVKWVNRHSGMVLDVIKAGMEDGAWTHQWVDVGAQSQQWLVQPDDDGNAKLISKRSGKCLDVVGMSQEDGAHVQIWTDTDGDNQKWILTPVKAKAPSSGKKTVKKTPAAKTALTDKEKAPAKDTIVEEKNQTPAKASSGDKKKQSDSSVAQTRKDSPKPPLRAPKSK